MDAPLWFGWVIIALLAIFSLLLFNGKFPFFMNNQHNYDEKKLNIVYGTGFSLITLICAYSLYLKYEYPYPVFNDLIPWGIPIILVLMLVLSNTICKK